MYKAYGRYYSFEYIEFNYSSKNLFNYSLPVVFPGCNDNPTAQQFEGAYRKLLLHNEVVSGKGANCLNDVTQVLYVSSKQKSVSKPINQSEVEMLANFDFENNIDHENSQLTTDEGSIFEQHSMAYLASIVEQKVLKKLNKKGSKTCSSCLQIFVENEITDNTFIQYKSENSNILPPCKSTIELFQSVENLLKIYATQNVSFAAMLLHIMQNINIDQFYKESPFGEDHNHKREFIELTIKSYMDVKSTQMCKVITILSQEKRKRHKNLKEVHRLGQ